MNDLLSEKAVVTRFSTWDKIGLERVDEVVQVPSDPMN